MLGVDATAFAAIPLPARRRNLPGALVAANQRGASPRQIMLANPSRWYLSMKARNENL